MLFFHHGGLGDFVLTWPLLLGAARVLAQSRVIAVVGADRGKLAEQVLRVETRDVEGGWSALFGDGDLPERPTKLIAKASHVISLVAPDDAKWMANAQRLAPSAEILMLRPPPRELQERHAIDHLLDQLLPHKLLHGGALGIVESIGRTGLMPRLLDRTGPIVLHVGSGATKKNWPLEQWVQLVELLRKQGRRVKVLVGEAESERLSTDDLSKLRTVADLYQPNDLAELLFVLRGTGLFVGHDTGPTHLAAMCGLPTHALFGPASNATAWGPVGPRVQVQQTDNLSQLDAELVARSLADWSH